MGAESSAMVAKKIKAERLEESQEKQIKNEPEHTALTPLRSRVKKEFKMQQAPPHETRKRIKREPRLVQEECNREEGDSERIKLEAKPTKQQLDQAEQSQSKKRVKREVKSGKVEKDSSAKVPARRAKRENAPEDVSRNAKVAAMAERATQLLADEYGAPVRGSATGVDAGNGCGAIRTGVLDSLVRTMLSQNTTDATSAVAFANLKLALPTWKQVLEAPEGAEEAVRCGGLADVKMARVRVILTQILSERPEQTEPSLEHLHDWENDTIKKYLGAMKGVGPKTISCVLMFT